MTFTVAEARGNNQVMMHCSKGHKFTLEKAYQDNWGTWCPDCGGDAHSYSTKKCYFCNDPRNKK